MDNTHAPDGSVGRQSSYLRAMRKAGDVDGLIRELGNPAEYGWRHREEEHHRTVRASAAIELAKFHDPRAVAPIAELLGDQRWSARALAAMALGKLGDPAAVGPLLDALGDEHRSVRCWAATSLGRLGDPTALDGLVAALPDENPYARVYVAEALARIGDRGAILPLKEAVRREGWRHPILRLRMMGALLRLRVLGRAHSG